MREPGGHGSHQEPLRPGAAAALRDRTAGCGQGSERVRGAVRAKRQPRLVFALYRRQSRQLSDDHARQRRVRGRCLPEYFLVRRQRRHPCHHGALVGSKYDRVPIGMPVHLDAGPQVISVQFKNSFGGGHEYRNLFLDTYELALVDEGPAPATAAAQTQTAASNPASAAAVPALHSAAPAAPAPALTAASAPRLSILYPANGAAVFGADAVVAQAAEARSGWKRLICWWTGGRSTFRCPTRQATNRSSFRWSYAVWSRGNTGSPCARQSLRANR